MDRIHRFVFEHRRSLAAVFAGLAVLTALSALRERPDGVAVLAAPRPSAWDGPAYGNRSAGRTSVPRARPGGGDRSPGRGPHAGW